MRRKDTSIIGDKGEAEAKKLLVDRGYECWNLNEFRPNYRTYDLKIGTANGKILVSVKTARAKRDVSLGKPESLKQLADDAFMMILFPSTKKQEIRFEGGGYHLLIVPGHIARDEALSSHYHYWGSEIDKAEKNTVRIKDKTDRPGGRSQLR